MSIRINSRINFSSLKVDQRGRLVDVDRIGGIYFTQVYNCLREDYYGGITFSYNHIYTSKNNW
jgi:hypothetical protein